MSTEKKKRLALNALVDEDVKAAIERLRHKSVPKISQGELVDVAVRMLDSPQGQFKNWRDAAMCHDSGCRYEAMVDGKEAVGALDLGTQAAADDLAVIWECEPAEALRRAVLRVLGVAQAGYIAAGGAVESGSSPEPSTLEGPVEVAGIQVGASNLPKNADCKHCGKKFAGARYASRCSDCAAAGHQMDPRGCDNCIERDGPA